MRLENLGCVSMREDLTWDLMESMSMGFLKPTTQLITWFIWGWRKSRPAGVRGSSESVAADEPITKMGTKRTSDCIYLKTKTGKTTSINFDNGLLA